jgi:energy-coupling factor transporter ATP-binding protein EcfA2
MSELYTNKYLPHTIKEYTGFNHQSVLRYIENVLAGEEKMKAIIFHGSAGCGKSVLANLLSEHFGISSHYTNASDSRKKKDVNSDIFRTTSLQSEKSLIIFDEVDGLSKSGFKELERILKKYNQPVILIANNLEKIPYSIRKICHIEKFAVDRFSMLALANKVVKKENLDLSREEIKKIVNQSKSFRSLLHSIQFGVGSRPPKQISIDEQVLANLSGQSVDLSTTDLSGLIIRFNDNSNSPNLISLADLWNHRYVSGYTFGKYIVRAILSSIRTPGIKKLEYPRTYSMIHTAKTGKKRIEHSGENKSTKPRIKIIGFK